MKAARCKLSSSSLSSAGTTPLKSTSTRKLVRNVDVFSRYQVVQSSTRRAEGICFFVITIIIIAGTVSDVFVFPEFFLSKMRLDALLYLLKVSQQPLPHLMAIDCCLEVFGCKSTKEQIV
jgi:hypothetical protein